MEYFAASEGPHISLAAEEIFRLGPLPVTNSMILGAIGGIATIALLFYAANMLKNGKRNFFVGLVQWAFEGFYGQAEDIIGDKATARRIFPLAITMFFLILVTYWRQLDHDYTCIRTNEAEHSS